MRDAIPTAGRRLASLDRLRVALVLGVVVFHAVRVFDPFDYYVKAPNRVAPLGPVVLFVSMWGMPVFFLLAGYGVWHSLGRRSLGAFVRERCRRLLLPFLAGVVLLVPPQLHFEALQAGERVSYVDTLRRFFHVGPRLEYPIPVHGQTFEPAHLWFLAYLLGFTLLLLPLFRWLRSPRGGRALDRALTRPALLLSAAAVVLGAAESALGSEAAGGWNRWAYPVFLIAGFVLAARPDVQARLVARWRALAVGGALAFIALAIAGAPLFERLGDQLQTGHDPAALLWRGAKAVIGGALVLGIVGFTLGRERAGSPGRVVAYGQRAALPAYVLHQTVAVALAYWILLLPIAPTLQWLMLTGLTLAVTLALCEALRRAPATRLLLGMRSASRAAPRRRLAQADPCVEVAQGSG
jgi:glucans biosynthesis protein C